MLENLINRIKSSPRFGELIVTKNIQELVKERRFLFFTKRGPIEVVFNIKHYVTGVLLSLFLVFKILQFAIFGAINIFTNVLIYKNSITNSQQFTKSEVEALKNIAEKAIEIEDYESNNKNNKNEKIDKSFAQNEINTNETSDRKDQENFVNLENLKNFANNNFSNIKDFFHSFKFDFNNSVSLGDESVFDDFASLASPEMVPIDEHIKKKEQFKLMPNEREKKIFLEKTYNTLPVFPFSAPRNNKTKIIQFSKTLDLEIIELVNVFKTLKLKPDKIDISKIETFLSNQKNLSDDSELINLVSTRFQYLEQLKDAIIFLPLKPPMQYYYVSSPFGFRTHPKTKKRQMHKGIDMAGTWQEEVRSSADGKVTFSGRNGSFGKTIKIKHKHGIITLYGHLHKLSVRKGDYVKEGQIIGKMGATGRVVGAHLHYEIIVNKKAINPYNFISIGRNLLSSSILKK